MSILKKAEHAAGDVAHAVDQVFESLHPRARKGTPDAGEFVDVTGILKAAGGTLDAERGVWRVPVDQRPVVDELLDHIGFDAISIPDGMHAVRDEDRMELGAMIKPAWTDVFVNDDRNGSMQVIGYDKKGVRQYSYHPDHTERKKLEKYNRVATLTDKLPDIDRALSDGVMHDDTNLGLMIMRKLAIRPGGSTTKGDEEAVGIIEMRREHVTITGDKVRFQFIGKHGIPQDLTLEDNELASAIKHRLPGLEAGDKILSTHNRKMSQRMKEIAGGDEYIPYDFRTHYGTSEALRLMDGMPMPTTAEEFDRQVKEVSERVSEKLGNTPKVALESYIDPRVFDGWPSRESLPGGDKVKISGAKKAAATRAAKAAAGATAPGKTPRAKAPPGQSLPERMDQAMKADPKMEQRWADHHQNAIDRGLSDEAASAEAYRETAADFPQAIAEPTGAQKAVSGRTKESLQSSAAKAVAARRANAERKAGEAEVSEPQHVFPTSQVNAKAQRFEERLGPAEAHALDHYLGDHGTDIDAAMRWQEKRPSAKRVPEIDKAFDRADALEQETAVRRFINLDDTFGTEDLDELTTNKEEFTDPRYALTTVDPSIQVPEGATEVEVRLPVQMRPVPVHGGGMLLPHGTKFTVVGHKEVPLPVSKTGQESGQTVYDNVAKGLKKAEARLRIGYSPSRAADVAERKEALKKVEHLNFRGGAAAPSALTHRVLVMKAEAPGKTGPKWEEFNRLSPLIKEKTDELAREQGVVLHSGSSAAEITKFIRLAQAQW